MLLFFWLLLSIPREIVGTRCVYAEQPFDYRLDDFNNEDFEAKLNEYPTYEYEDDNINMCRVEIFVDYQIRSLTISFADTFDWSQLDDREGRLDFLTTLNQNNEEEKEFYNVLEYACFDVDQCNKFFVLHHIHWLQNVNYTIFQKHLKSKLFSRSTPLEKCYTDHKSLINCSTGVCVGKYSYYYKNYFFQCQQNPDGLVEVHITTNMIINKNSLNNINIEQNQIVRYTCKFNQCNDQNLTDSLVSIVENYFPLSGMKDALLLPYPQLDQSTSNFSDQITFQTPTEQSSSLTTTTITRDLPSNIANTPFYLSINLAFMILFILFDI